MNYVSPKQACLELGICNKTLQRWRLQNKINWIKPGERKYFYCIEDIKNKKLYTPNNQDQNQDNTNNNIQTVVPSEPKRINYTYCRVSSIGQKEDLKRQQLYLQKLYPNHVCLTDIGSGLNFKRKGLKTILDTVLQGNIGQIVVAHKDRLCRFGFDIIKYIVEKQKGQIMVLNDEKSSPENELVHDLISIITCFSARIYGLRSYKSKIKEDKDLPQ
jgi:predicted site-specific integrase-resolvase